MRIYRAKSFFMLVFTGLAFVALPLIIVLVASEVLMGQLAKHSSLSVYRSVTAGQLSQELVELILNQERRTRQYNVLGDGRLLADVVERHGEIQDTLTELAAIPYDQATRLKIKELAQNEMDVFSSLASSERSESNATEALLGFEQLNSLSREIFKASIAQTFQEAAALQNEADRAQTILLWLAIAMFPLTLGLVFYFSRLIYRPIKQLDFGINRLGQGDFITPVKVSGPQDLVFLGKRLDWLREKLAVFEKDKTKFAAHVSHELKTPLASLREGAELLADEVAGPVNVKQREIVEILKKNCTQLQNLIENLLGYTMAEARKTSLHPGNVQVKKIVGEVLAAHKPMVLKNSLSLDVSVEDVIIEADPERFYAIINNLFSNAVKYSPVDGEIKVSVVQHNKRLVVDVIDSGPGIAKGEVQDIFLPFFQGQATCRSPIKGTGLGLAIALEYVKAHRGTLSLVPKKDCGAHFRVVLPVAYSMESTDDDQGN